jgi:hypothetical protein
MAYRFFTNVFETSLEYDYYVYREDGADSCHIVWSIEHRYSHLSPLLHEQARQQSFENIF